MQHGLSPPSVLPQCQPTPGTVRAFLSAVLGDYRVPDSGASCFHGTRSKTARQRDEQCSDLYEERDSDDEQDGEVPGLVETSDDDSDVDSVDGDAGAGSGEVSLDAPRRYPLLPAVSYARPGILGPEYPPYALLDEMDYAAGANRVVLFDIGYYDAKVIKGRYTCFLLGCDYKTHNVYYKPLRKKDEIARAYCELALENGWPKLSHVVHVVSDGESVLVKQLREGCERMGQSFSMLPPETPNANLAGSNTMRHLKAMVRSFLVDASRHGSAIDSSYEDYAYRHAVQVRNCSGLAHHPSFHSPHRLHYGLPPVWDFLPWGCPVYITQSEKAGKLHLARGGQPGATCGEGGLYLGRADPTSRVVIVATRRRTLRRSKTVYVDVNGLCGVFPGDLPEKGSEPGSSRQEASVLDKEAAVLDKEAPAVSPECGPVPVSELVSSKVRALEEAADRRQKQRKLQKSSIRLLSVYDECCRLIRPVDYRAAPTAYINRRCDALVGRTVAEALASSFVDNTGTLRPYRRRDLDYDIKAKRLEIRFEGSNEELPIAEEAHLACLHAVHGAESSAFYTADVETRIEHLASLVQVAAMKDLDWQEQLRGPNAEAVKAAFEREMASLVSCQAAYRVPPGHPEYEAARRSAILCRVLLDLKRSSEWKARCVLQGFRQNRLEADGADYCYYAAVARLATVRLAALRSGRHVPREGRSGVRELSTRDISTAFLQSTPFPETDRRYIKVKNPMTGLVEYWRQLRPLYGEGSAPARWSKTLSDWLCLPESEGGPGFTRGRNDSCIYYHQQRDLLVCVYVDDLLADGFREDLVWLYELMDKRFVCKPPQYLSPENPIDYLGMLIFQTDKVVGVSMQSYIEKMQVALGMENAKPHEVPFVGDVTDHAPLPESLHGWFRRALGMVGWCTATVRVDARLGHSRIAQHTAAPTRGAYDALYKLVRYLIGTKSWCLVQDLHKDVEWSVYSDAELAGNTEPQACRRSQLGYMLCLGQCPVVWQSKCSTVQFYHSAYPAGFSAMKPVTAHPLLDDEHADFSSAASELYAAANCVNDVIHMSYCCEESGMPFKLPFVLNVDNQAAISFMTLREFAGKTKLKHIDARSSWVQSLRDANIVRPQYCPTERQLADWLTKPLAAPKFCRFRSQLMRSVPLSFTR